MKTIVTIFSHLFFLVFLTNSQVYSQDLNEQMLRAVEKRDSSKVKELLSQGADPNYVNVYNMPPLIIASALNDTTVIRLLVDAGADLNRIGLCPTEVGFPVSQYLTPLTEAIYDSCINAFKILLERGAIVSAFGNTSPLIAAATAGRTEMMKSLVNAGADVNETIDYEKNSDRGKGLTALLMAVLVHNVDCVSFLLDQGADPNVEFKFDYAVMSNTTSYRVYSDNDTTDTKSTNNSYITETWTPLGVAIDKNLKDIEGLLKQHGAVNKGDSK